MTGRWVRGVGAQDLVLGEETLVRDDSSDSAPLVSPLSERASVVDDDTQVASGEEMEVRRCVRRRSSRCQVRLVFM